MWQTLQTNLYIQFFFLFFIDNDKPLLRLCLRLPTGDKETISMCATNTIEVSVKIFYDMLLIIYNFVVYTYHKIITIYNVI